MTTAEEIAEGAVADLKVEHDTIIEQMRFDNSEAIQDVQASAAERVDAAQERVKVVEEQANDIKEAGEKYVKSVQAENDTLRETHARELHDQGKTIARMKGEIRHLSQRLLERTLGHAIEDPPTEDDLAVDPVPGENEETD